MAICNLDHLVAEFPKRHYAVVGGAFDPLHSGHLAYLWAARRYGPLVAVVTPDAVLAATKRPHLLPQDERAKVLNDCRAVDYVTVGAIVPVLDALCPLAYVTGPDWEGRLPLETREACVRFDVVVVHMATRSGSSTAFLDDYQRRLNAEKLADMEAWVSTQPAPPAWTPVTDYSFDARKAIEGPHADLIRETFTPTTVLDVGCGPGHLVRMLQELGTTARGVDLPWFDLRGYAEPHAAEDLVICREVLEHLRARDIPQAVANLVRLSTRYVYLTTRFTTQTHPFGFDHRDDLDPTHVTMLNQDYLRSLFVLHGCTRRADLETRMDWRKLGRVLVYEVPQ